MTKKLYYEAIYQTEFDANVMQQEKKDGQVHVVLDQTVFYPGGGGQPCDLGMLDSQAVERVYEQGGEIFHVISNELSSARVHGIIDWARRFELMQQHLGQHILSAVFVRDFSKNTVGLRLDRDMVSINLDGYVSEQHIAEAELAANDIIYQNVAAQVLYPCMDEIKRNSKREIPQSDEAIRIIRITDLDYTPCCGLHTSTTGEVGIIKLKMVDKHNGCSRILFTCGRNALLWVASVCKSTLCLQQEFNCLEDEIVARVFRQRDELQVSKQKNQQLMKQFVATDAQKLVNNASKVGDIALVTHILPNTTQGEMKQLYEELTANKGVIALLGGEASNGAFLMFGCNKAEKRVDVRDAFKHSLTMIGGKGGGGACYAQGFSSDSAKLSEAMDCAQKIMADKLQP